VFLALSAINLGVLCYCFHIKIIEIIKLHPKRGCNLIGHIKIIFSTHALGEESDMLIYTITSC
jgi:hypothetical protein